MIHIHCDSRRSGEPVFHMTDALCRAALARAPQLDGRIRITAGWNGEGMETALRTAEILVGFHVPTAMIATAPRLRMIHIIGAGIEHLRPLGWLPPHVVLTNNRGVHRQKAAEFILMALLALNARLPALVNAQARRRWAPHYTSQARGKTVLIVGLGGLGGAGASAARQFGFTVLGIRRSGAASPECDETYGPDALPDLLPRADFVVLTMPLTAETAGMFDAAAFDRMKPGAGFVNFGRAGLCDYQALAERLRSGHLSGAMLDVFDPEPLPADSCLWDVPNLIITPHCSSDDAVAYIPATLDLVLENAGRLLAGDTLRNVVDPAREY